MNKSENQTRISDKLIPEFTGTDQSTMEDFLAAMAGTIEDSLRQCGAQPGKDYTYLDLYKLAQPFALKKFTDGDLTYIHSWPRMDKE